MGNARSYILTEYTELGELFQYVQQNLLLPQYVHRYFCQLISAVSHLIDRLDIHLGARCGTNARNVLSRQVAHLARFRICHRDIKLENIMMWRDEDGEVSIKLIDFGMATYQPEGELLTMSCGSPHYAAPEIMEVSRTYEPVLSACCASSDSDGSKLMPWRVACRDRVSRTTASSPTPGPAASSSTP